MAPLLLRVSNAASPLRTASFFAPGNAAASKIGSSEEQTRFLAI
jgi:hypothetical protein